MFVFITYAERGMKGVQIRGIRAASGFQAHEVKFINQGDDTWLRHSGYPYQQIDEGFRHPDQIKFPRGTRAVIFSDLPTNNPFQIAYLLAAQNARIPCVLLDNIYSWDQMRETVWRNTVAQFDRTILNGLSFFDRRKMQRVYIVPPLMRHVPNKKVVDNFLFDRFGIERNDRYIFATGYNSLVLDLVRHIAKKISNKFPDIKIYVAGTSVRTVHKHGKMVLLPQLREEEMRMLLSRAEFFMGKMGYLQLIEALSMKKPVLAVGDDYGFRLDWLDQKMRKVIWCFPRMSKNLIGAIEHILNRDAVYKTLLHHISLLHNGSFDAIERTARLIRQTKFHAKPLRSAVFLSVEHKHTHAHLEQALKKYPFLFPIILSFPKLYSTDKRYSAGRKHEHILAGFYELAQFSPHDFHGNALIFSWYALWWRQVKELIAHAGVLIIDGKETRALLQPMILYLAKHSRVHYIL